MNVSNLAKFLIIIGIVIGTIGLLLLFLAKLGFPIGKLPGDLYIKKEKFAIYFPIITSVIISVLLTFIINFILWIFKK
jgi:hypothetical protein